MPLMSFSVNLLFRSCGKTISLVLSSWHWHNRPSAFPHRTFLAWRIHAPIMAQLTRFILNQSPFSKSGKPVIILLYSSFLLFHDCFCRALYCSQTPLSAVFETMAQTVSTCPWAFRCVSLQVSPDLRFQLLPHRISRAVFVKNRVISIQCAHFFYCVHGMVGG